MGILFLLNESVANGLSKTGLNVKICLPVPKLKNKNQTLPKFAYGEIMHSYGPLVFYAKLSKIKKRFLANRIYDRDAPPEWASTRSVPVKHEPGNTRPYGGESLYSAEENTSRLAVWFESSWGEQREKEKKNHQLHTNKQWCEVGKPGWH